MWHSSNVSVGMYVFLLVFFRDIAHILLNFVGPGRVLLVIFEFRLLFLSVVVCLLQCQKRIHPKLL